MNGEYWQPEIETMPREELKKLQTEKLRRTIETALNSPFYGQRLGRLGITPDSIKTVDDIRKIRSPRSKTSGTTTPSASWPAT